MLFTPHKDKNSRFFCGPTALMAITGIPGTVVREAVREARGNPTKTNGAKRPVMGVSNEDLLNAIEVLGWRVVDSWEAPDHKLRPDKPDARGYHKRWKRPDGFKPLKFSEFLADKGAGGPYIVNVTGHYMAVSSGEVCDAWDAPLCCDIDRYLKMGKRRFRHAWVQKWWKIEKVESRTGLEPA